MSEHRSKQRAYFYKAAGFEFGPFSKAELFEEAEQGRLTFDCYVRPAGSEKWYPASDIKGLITGNVKSVSASEALASSSAVASRNTSLAQRIALPSLEAGQIVELTKWQKLSGSVGCSGILLLLSPIAIPMILVFFVFPPIALGLLIAYLTFPVYLLFQFRALGKCPLCTETLDIYKREGGRLCSACKQPLRICGNELVSVYDTSTERKSNRFQHSSTDICTKASRQRKQLQLNRTILIGGILVLGSLVFLFVANSEKSGIKNWAVWVYGSVLSSGLFFLACGIFLSWRKSINDI